MSLKYPEIIQGGMGVGVSGWELANAVSRTGELGVISGTGVAILMARRLQQGNQDYLRALDHFPDPAMADRVINKYYLPGGKPADKRFKPVQMFLETGPSRSIQELVVTANFAEVYLAKEGHSGRVGVNYLEKLQRPHLLSLYGAMLGGVDYVLMGAGIPTQIPGALDQLSKQTRTEYQLDVLGASPREFIDVFDPQTFSASLAVQELRRPDFLAIISSVVLAKLFSKPEYRANGFIIEGPTAGGHNAPPRKKDVFNDRGEPIYGEKDEVDLEKIAAQGIPFWLAGSFGHPDGLRLAHNANATGIQVGSLFALCEQSGLLPEYRDKLRRLAYLGELDVYTDPKASPSGYPFKVAQIPGSISQLEVYLSRPRICDVGYLQDEIRLPSGAMDLRCPSEPVDEYLKKGGHLEDTEGRKCLCNGLFAAIGLAQHQPKTNYIEKPIFTIGDDHRFLQDLMKNENDRYSAQDAIAYLRGQR